MTVVVEGRAAFAALLRLLATQIEGGTIVHPFSIQPAPHLGPFVVRVGGVDYDLAEDLPGLLVGEDDTPATVPGKSQS